MAFRRSLTAAKDNRGLILIKNCHLNALGLGHKCLTHLSLLSAFTPMMSISLHQENPETPRQSVVDEAC